MKISRRNTKSKQAILDIFRARHVVTASEVIAQIPDVDPSTVYRNLKRFSTDDVLQEIVLPDGQTAYELSTHEHIAHFLCNHCKKVRDISELVNTQKLEDALSIISISSIVIQGMCKRCSY